METKRRRFWGSMNMNDLARNFFEGLLILVPVVTTLYVAWLILETIDGWLNIPIPGVGFLVTLLLITLTGRYASTVFVQKMVDMMEATRAYEANIASMDAFKSMIKKALEI